MSRGTFTFVVSLFCGTIIAVLRFFVAGSPDFICRVGLLAQEDHLVNVEKKVFDSSHRDKLSFVGLGLVTLETWGVGNEAVHREAFCTPHCRDILLYNDVEGGSVLVDITGKTADLSEGRPQQWARLYRDPHSITANFRKVEIVLVEVQYRTDPMRAAGSELERTARPVKEDSGYVCIWGDELC
ncbi:hypothetical protein C8J57DRAFT_1257160 [Mycena rebaudengoi]|nr:hypothetical protein C8J57DRAFT_1257160 [Mycena rebaudengoi]